MSMIQLPRDDALNLEKLTSVPLLELQEFFRVLQTVEPGIYVLTPLTDAVREFAVKHDIDPGDLARVVWAVNRTRLVSDELTDADYVYELSTSAEKVLGHALDRSILQTLITNILGLSNIRLSIKATLLAFEHEYHIHEINVVSDMRPVFSMDRENIDAMLITQTLKISCASDSERTKTLYFAIDDDDLDQIDRSIQRARRKKKALTEMIEKLGIRQLEVK